jgi:transcription antitermination factor NusG
MSKHNEEYLKKNSENQMKEGSEVYIISGTHKGLHGKIIALN